jgi:hypothetical protein
MSSKLLSERINPNAPERRRNVRRIIFVFLKSLNGKTESLVWERHLTSSPEKRYPTLLG